MAHIGPPDKQDPARDEPATLNSSTKSHAYVSSAVGGSVSLVSFEEGEPSNRIGAARGGGVRGRVKGFSGACRRNLLRHLASINRTAFRAFKGRVFSVTLTYSHRWPEDAQTCKGHLKALRKRMERRFGADFAGFWRLGVQRRGAWHFHLLLFVPPGFGSMADLRSFVAASWYEVCGKLGEGHLRAGTRVEEVRTWRRATSYAERYVAKREDFPEGTETGRVWGTWNGETLPVRWETVRVSREDAYRIRRAYRRLAKMRATGHLRWLTVFVRHENVLRLLEFFGYRQDE